MIAAENESVLQAILARVHEGKSRVVDAENAIRLAQTARDLATLAQFDILEAAGRDLETAWTNGAPNIEVLRTKYVLDGLDPSEARLRCKDDLTGDELVARYESLTEGQPVLDLRGNNKRGDIFGVTGIVTGEPTGFRVIPQKIDRQGDQIYSGSLVPDIGFLVPVKTGDGIRTPEVRSYTLRSGLIGREAIERAAQAATFSIDYDDACDPFSYDSQHRLTVLRNEIDSLYDLGMEEIDTGALDQAIIDAKRYADSEQYRRAATLTHQRSRFDRTRRYRVNR